MTDSTTRMAVRWAFPRGVRAAIVVCTVIFALAGFGRFGAAEESTPKPTLTPAACVRPNVPASVVHAVRGIVSPMAEQQDLYGRVDVVVSLDAASRIVGARILRSPFGVLKPAAIEAAQASSFQTAIVDCRPIASDVMYTVDFPEKITYATAASGARTISIFADATVTRAPDVAYVEARIATNDNLPTGATAKNDAVLEALKAKLRTLGIAGGKIRATWSLRPPTAPAGTPPPVREGYLYPAQRRIDVTVDAVPNAGNVAAAMSSVRGVDVPGIRYALNDRASAYREARDIALKDAEASANRNLTPQHLSLGPLLRVDLAQTYDGTPPTEFVPFYTGSNHTPSPALTIPAMQVRAAGTVTYAIKP